MNQAIKNFFDLNVWQEGCKLARAIYEVTARFPSDERFGLISQMRRSSVSVIANIAEGFGRISIKEKLHFYNQAHGSLTELQSHMYIAEDLTFLSRDEYSRLLPILQSCQALLQGFMRSTRKRLSSD
jgi:four helix bundle protein